MALVMTIARDSNPNSATASSVSEEDFADEKVEDVGELPVLKKPATPPTKRLIRQGSVSENFFAVKGAALILPRQTSLNVQNMVVVKKYGGELRTHLRAIFQHLRSQDNIKLAVRLESWKESHRRYLVVISTAGRQDTEESIIVGCDFDSEESSTCTIGLVLPVWCDTNIRLDGDGGFHVECGENIHTFKPVSVQAMWSALQSLNRCVEVARKNNYFEGSLYLTWTGFYTNKINSVRLYINEWMYREDILNDSKNKYMKEIDPERAPVELLIRNTLKPIMMNMDLDNCTCKDIRVALEAKIDVDLKNYKEYINEEMLTILGQMDCPSQILDYLYLGSEWNASNLEELQSLGITHILNVTIEVDNFFPELFQYKAIRLYDEEISELLPHWNHTWKYIAVARKSGGKILVHCRMGISRSAATVCAYLMKENGWRKSEAIEYVKSKRPIICPNSGFQKQLDEYEGILSASSHRHNKLFRSRSENSLAEKNTSEEHLQANNEAPPTVQVGGHVDDEQRDVTDSSTEFDLNRHLLDITSLAAPNISRPKSWSPDEGRAPYVSSNIENSRKQSDSRVNQPANHTFSVKNSSESLELLETPSGIPLRSGRIKELRQNFTRKRANLRRQTADGRVPLEDDFALSEDSVFVHDGNTPVQPRSNRSLARSSSPAALCAEVLQESSATHHQTEFQKNVKYVESTSSPLDKELDDASNVSSKSEVFVKAHHKALSLPFTASNPSPIEKQENARSEDDVTQNRSQSCSDAPSSVKQIVTAIESLHSPEIENSNGIKRSASLPSWRKNGGSLNPTQNSESIKEADDNSTKPDATEESTFVTGDTDSDDRVATERSDNLNSNNNNSSILSAASEVTNDITSASSLQSDGFHEERRHMSPDFLRMIREIAVHLEKAENMDPSNLTSGDPAFAPSKKRGVVRQMVREIEKGVRRLTGKSPKSEKKTKTVESKPPYSDEVCSSADNQSADCATRPIKPSAPRIDLVTPPPYRTPLAKEPTSPGKSRFKLAVTVPRVRRTMSERAGLKPQTFKKPGFFRSFRTVDSNLSLKQELQPLCSLASKEELDGDRTKSESFERASSDDDTSLMMSSFPFRRVASSPQLMLSQSASITFLKQNVFTSESTDQVRL